MVQGGKFWAELRIYFLTQNNTHSLSLCSGSINCANGARAVLEATIGKHLNGGFHFLVRKVYAVVHNINVVQHIVAHQQQLMKVAFIGLHCDHL